MTDKIKSLDNDKESVEVMSVESVENLDSDDKALLEYGKNVIINSGETIKNFAQTTITLASGLFATYFALLRFLGIDYLISNNMVNLSTDIIIIPPVFLILSIIAQILAILPLPGKLSLIFLTELEKDRRRSCKT